VDGSVEAINSVLSTYDSDLCDLEIIQSGVGEVTENDVELAADFNGMIVISAPENICPPLAY